MRTKSDRLLAIAYYPEKAESVRFDSHNYRQGLHELRSDAILF